MALDDATDVSHLNIEPLKNTTYTCSNCKFWVNKDYTNVGICNTNKVYGYLDWPDSDVDLETFGKFGCVRFQPRSMR